MKNHIPILLLVKSPMKRKQINSYTYISKKNTKHSTWNKNITTITMILLFVDQTWHIYIYTHEKRQKITTPYQTSCQTFPIYHIILSSSKKKPNISYIHIIYIYIYIHIFPGYSQTSFHHRPKMQFWSLISYKCLFFTGLYIL